MYQNQIYFVDFSIITYYPTFITFYSIIVDLFIKM